jgi:hypothetical protein
LIEYLYEKYLAKKAHEAGTYISLKLDAASAKALDDWTTDNNIENPLDPSDYHVTVIYSRKGIPAVEGHEFDLPIVAKVSAFEIFPTQTGNECLVAKVDSKDLTDLHKSIRKEYGATHDYPEYKPHVTLSYDYKGELPKDVPDITVTFNKVVVQPLDPDFKPKVK